MKIVRERFKFHNLNGGFWGALKASFEQLGGMGFDAVALQRYPEQPARTVRTQEEAAVGADETPAD